MRSCPTTSRYLQKSRCVTRCVPSKRSAPLEKRTSGNAIDANLSELSPFHQAFGYYVHGVAI